MTTKPIPHQPATPPPAPKPFRLQTLTTKGKGLQIHGGWDQIRNWIYPPGKS